MISSMTDCFPAIYGLDTFNALLTEGAVDVLAQSIDLPSVQVGG